MKSAVNVGAGELPGAHALDRRRIDSDVREMLRQPSTPWITFNRASRASNLAVGDLLPRRVSVVDAGALAAAPEPVVITPPEPSGLSVSSDVGAEPATGVTNAPVVAEPSRSSKRRRSSGWSPLNIAVVCAGLTLSAGLVLSTTLYQSPAARAAAESKAAAEKAAAPEVKSQVAAEADLPPPDLAAGLANASIGRASTESNEAATTATASSKKESKFGRLTIRGSAKNKNVYLDGKRLLGSGTRSFTVHCGTHTVSTKGRHDGKEVVVPCNGELVVDR